MYYPKVGVFSINRIINYYNLIFEAISDNEFDGYLLDPDLKNYKVIISRQKCQQGNIIYCMSLIMDGTIIHTIFSQKINF